MKAWFRRTDKRFVLKSIT